MSIKQFLRIVWARKWLVLALLVIVSIAGTATTLLLPKQYTAETALIVEMRIDPVLGAIAPSLAMPGYMATQIDILKSERVAGRVVKMLGVERS
ncbi:MAG: chain length determinant protein EpsF, partial [Burkholderiales bacterium]|nr:chain length determinant protein EpsF [Burkholderiales bacterium]